MQQRKKHIIWSSRWFYDKENRKAFEENFKKLYPNEEYTDEIYFKDVSNSLDTEKKTLEGVKVEGVIIVLDDIGLWYGRRQSATILDTIPEIFSTDKEDKEWFIDGWNVRSVQGRDNGINRLLYRVAKDRKTAERLAWKVSKGIYNENQLMRYTKSLKPYFTKNYGKI